MLSRGKNLAIAVLAVSVAIGTLMLYGIRMGEFHPSFDDPVGIVVTPSGSIQVVIAACNLRVSRIVITAAQLEGDGVYGEESTISRNTPKDPADRKFLVSMNGRTDVGQSEAPRLVTGKGTRYAVYVHFDRASHVEVTKFTSPFVKPFFVPTDTAARRDYEKLAQHSCT